MFLLALVAISLPLGIGIASGCGFGLTGALVVSSSASSSLKNTLFCKANELARDRVFLARVPTPWFGVMDQFLGFQGSG